MSRQMHLAFFFLPVGRIEGAWRRDDGRAEMLWGLDLPRHLALQAEAAKFDAVFFGDFMQLFDVGRRPQEGAGYEPITTMAAVAAVTSRIGLIGTLSTSFVEPYDAARYLASVDHLSGGRAGWNIVTSVVGDHNYGTTLPPKAERYRRAAEHVAATKAFWDAWPDDAVVIDRGDGSWARADEVKPIDFDGEFVHLSGAGPLGCHRSPQGWPVLAQAGQSDDGRDFAAATAEVIFTSQNHVDLAKEFRSDIHARAALSGRQPHEVKILPGYVPIVGRSDEHAAELAAELDGMLDVDRGRQRLAADLLGATLDDLELDRPVPLDRLRLPEEVDHNAATPLITASRYRNYYNIVAAGEMTLRELILERERGGGHAVIVGTAETVADHMEAWFLDGACDGFMITLPFTAGLFDNVCDLLVPELQRRGLFRNDYTGATLRDHLGLARPAVPPAIKE